MCRDSTFPIFSLFTLNFLFPIFFCWIFVFHLSRSRLNYANHVWRRIKINWREICIFIEHFAIWRLWLIFIKPTMHGDFQWRTGMLVYVRESTRIHEGMFSLRRSQLQVSSAHEILTQSFLWGCFKFSP